MESHVDVRRKHGHQESHQAPSSPTSDARDGHPNSQHNFTETAHMYEEAMPGQVWRHDAHIEIRLKKMIQTGQNKKDRKGILEDELESMHRGARLPPNRLELLCSRCARRSSQARVFAA